MYSGPDVEVAGGPAKSPHVFEWLVDSVGIMVAIVGNPGWIPNSIRIPESVNSRARACHSLVCKHFCSVHPFSGAVPFSSFFLRY
jgi:hypothetical protein